MELGLFVELLFFVTIHIFDLFQQIAASKCLRTPFVLRSIEKQRLTEEEKLLFSLVDITILDSKVR